MLRELLVVAAVGAAVASGVTATIALENAPGASVLAGTPDRDDVTVLAGGTLDRDDVIDRDVFSVVRGDSFFGDDADD